MQLPRKKYQMNGVIPSHYARKKQKAPAGALSKQWSYLFDTQFS